jgi:hypothetical protein
MALQVLSGKFKYGATGFMMTDIAYDLVLDIVLFPLARKPDLDW